MGLEYELKFRADRDTLQAIAGQLPPPDRRLDMQTTYYDTRQRSLSARHMTLRRRLENGRSICTVKTPAGERDRGEWETECDSIQTAIDGLCKLGAPRELLALTENGLEPVCGARFRRTAWDLFIADTLLELALDDGVLAGGSREEAFQEVEVELKEGDREICDAFAADLAKACGLSPEKKSKFRRALALAEGE